MADLDTRPVDLFGEIIWGIDSAEEAMGLEPGLDLRERSGRRVIVQVIRAQYRLWVCTNTDPRALHDGTSRMIRGTLDTAEAVAELCERFLVEMVSIDDVELRPPEDPDHEDGAGRAPVT